MASILEATVVTTGPLNDEVHYVGWSVDGGNGDSLMVMRNFDDPEGYCLLANYATHYGGVQGVEVTEGQVRLLLTAEAAADLGTNAEVIIRYPPECASVDALRADLSKLLA